MITKFNLKMMTKEDLEKMGIIHLERKLYPNKFFVPQIGEVNLHEPYRWEDIFQKIYDGGYENGTRNGEAKKISEIKRVLNIEDGQQPFV
jgi:hypothetical protein